MATQPHSHAGAPPKTPSRLKAEPQSSNYGSHGPTPPRTAKSSGARVEPAFFNQQRQVKGPPMSPSKQHLKHVNTPPPDKQLREDDNIKVVVRIRPMNERETAAGDVTCAEVSPDDLSSVQVSPPAGGKTAAESAAKSYQFHGVLPPTCKQADVVRACGITQLLDAALAGFHVTIFAYGQTGSGKTFTMSGREDVLALDDYAGDSDDGIVTRSIMYLFEQLAKRPANAAPINIKASYCEIYNEALYDLLKFSKQQLPVRWDAHRGFHAPDLMQRDCSTMADLTQVISRGMRNRKVGSHELNMESSRSHSIVTVYCDTPAGEEIDSCARYGKVSFVDLAGSERVKDTKASGEMLKETSSINRSLFTLGKVISALAERESSGPTAVPHIPYRDSKLTKLLMDSLGGSALALMVACISPSGAAMEETLSTLSYAARAKNIRNRPAVQMDPKDAAILALRQEVELLRSENVYLRDQLDLAEAAVPAPLSIDGAPAPAVGTPAILPGGLTARKLPQGDGEVLATRIAEAEMLLTKYSKENERLAGQNVELRQRRQFMDQDYTGALEEVDWLRMKLEKIEGALKAQAHKGGAVSRLLSRQPTTLRETHVKPRTSGAGVTVQEDVSAQMEEFNEELASLLRNIAEDAKTERATDDDGAGVGSRPLSSGHADAVVIPLSICQSPSDSPQPYMSSGGPSKSPAKTPPASSGDAEPSGSPAPDERQNSQAAASPSAPEPHTPQEDQRPQGSNARSGAPASAPAAEASSSQPANMGSEGLKASPQIPPGPSTDQVRAESSSGPGGGLVAPQSSHTGGGSAQGSHMGVGAAQTELLPQRPMSRRGREAAAFAASQAASAPSSQASSPAMPASVPEPGVPGAGRKAAGSRAGDAIAVNVLAGAAANRDSDFPIPGQPQASPAVLQPPPPAQQQQGLQQPQQQQQPPQSRGKAQLSPTPSSKGAEEQIPAIKAEKSEGKGWLKGRSKGKGADSKNAEGHIVADPAKLALLLS